MKKSLLIAFCMLTGATTLPAQKKEFIIDVPPCSQFNISKFEKNVTEGKYGKYEYYIKDGLKVTQTKQNTYYDETIIREGTPLKKRRMYHLNSGKLWIDVNYFYNCETGITKKYDESGKQIEERDEDAPCAFSISDVVKKIKKEFDIDLTKPRYGMSVSRGTGYMVYFGSEKPLSINSFVEKVMLCGTTGEILMHAAKDGEILIDKTKKNEDETVRQTSPRDKKYTTIRDKEGIGLIDETGKVVILPIYASIDTVFSNGLSKVQTHTGKYGLIAENGKELLPAVYDCIWNDNILNDDFRESLIKVSKDGLQGFVNLQGQMVIPFKYQELKQDHDGMIWFMQKPKRWGCINYKNEIVVQPEFTHTAPFVYGKATAQKADAQTYFIYSNGTVEKESVKQENNE